MSFYGQWRGVGVVGTDVSEESVASISRVDKSGSEEQRAVG
jgi:hypothetical protein